MKTLRVLIFITILLWGAQAFAATCESNLVQAGANPVLAAEICTSSGTITANQFTSTDDISVADDAVIGGDVTLTGLLTKIITVTNNDAQNNTLSVAELVGGVTVHTSVTGGGTVTTDTAANIIAGSSDVGVLGTNGQCYMHWYINDGNQTLTFAGGEGVTISDTGQTLAANEAAVLLVCRASATTVTVYIVGA